jgi:hypothetical protein
VAIAHGAGAVVAGWLGVGVGGGASADPAIREGSAVEGEGRGHAFGVGMSDPGRKTRRGGGSSSRGAVRGGGSSSRAECGMRGGRRKTRAAAGITAPRERGRNIAGGGVVRLVDALRPPLRISRDSEEPLIITFTNHTESSQSMHSS